jgi:GNAT superfamily N-acetyltransferase
MSNLIIRDFLPADQEEARALILSGLAERWDDLDETLNPDLDDIGFHYKDAVFLVAEQEGRLVATGALVPEGAGVGRIVRMSVARASRRQGIGKQVLETLSARARALGYCRLVLETTASWEDAIHFYEAHGFRAVAQRDGDRHFVRDLEELP